MTWGYQTVEDTNEGEGLWFQHMIMRTMIWLIVNI